MSENVQGLPEPEAQAQHLHVCEIQVGAVGMHQYYTAHDQAEWLHAVPHPQWQKSAYCQPYHHQLVALGWLSQSGEPCPDFAAKIAQVQALLVVCPEAVLAQSWRHQTTEVQA